MRQARRRCRLCHRHRRWQHHSKRCPAADLAFDKNLPTHPRDNGVTNGKAEACPDSNGLRREEWVKNALGHLNRDTLSCIRNLDHSSAVCVSGSTQANLMSRSIALGDRLSFIDEQVNENLSETCFVCIDERDLLVVLHEPRAMADLVESHING